MKARIVLTLATALAISLCLPMTSTADPEVSVLFSDASLVTTAEVNTESGLVLRGGLSIRDDVGWNASLGRRWIDSESRRLSADLAIDFEQDTFEMMTSMPVDVRARFGVGWVVAREIVQMENDGPYRLVNRVILTGGYSRSLRHRMMAGRFFGGLRIGL